ncbi:hypothetical protein HK413_01395 [Mucilaginibacter sp. S1162]|uniref:Uncharacterized protein n=1 Tax=Mucilaginibacter humi TaxID=2732510 RepID=A0ABX1VZV7_9SPHI|nr:hypothetical protein [Mucilaginibacter humi]NNU33164.1 hypothetical protein [Mucilaginibacter humi]
MFASVLKKKESSGTLLSFKNNRNQKVDNTGLEVVKAYIDNPASYYFFKVNDDWLAINNQHRESLNLLQHHLYIKKSGVRIGKLAGRDLIPDHELALSTIVNKDAVLQTELSYDDAILYLRRENLNIDTDKKAGV